MKKRLAWALVNMNGDIVFIDYAKQVCISAALQREFNDCRIIRILYVG